MKISILCTAQDHPVVTYLKKWQQAMNAMGHSVLLHCDKSELSGGDVLFLVSCGQIISEKERGLFKTTLVLHASDLPAGRGWSPHIWTILAGENRVVVSLLEAAEPIDSGDVWLKTSFTLEGHELLTEINERLFTAELNLMTEAVQKFDEIKPVKQIGESGPYLRMRTPEDSQLDPNLSIVDQFNLLRVVDSERYPAFFVYRNRRYLVKIEKFENEE
jgi:methionyl-tRNA formyltransferase